ncbi:PAS domain-containing protein, partial [bacterium]|nr:PAS domain-containing protein [bacterium]
FHWMRAAERRRGGAVILATALLAAFANSAPVAAGVDARRRVLVELDANARTEIPSNSRQIDLDETLDYLSRKEELLDVLEASPGPESSNLAFILWAKSPLASLPAGSDLRIRDASGRAFSRFSLGFPAELRADDGTGPDALPAARLVSFRRQEIGVQRIDTYAGSTPIRRGDRVLGALEITMAYPDDLGRRTERHTDVSRVFTNRPPPSEFLRFTREVPERVTRYRGETLVASTDPEGGVGTRVHPTIVRALEGRSASGTWVAREIRGQKWNLYCVRERDGEVTVGYLTFGIRERSPTQIAWFVVRCALVTLTLAAGLLFALVVASRLLPRGEFPHRLDVPRPGFRERVIGGFLLVSLLPTILLGLAGKQLIEREKRSEFVERLEGDLRISRELLGSRLSDAARNAAGADEVRELFAERLPYRTISTPASVGGILVMSSEGQLLGASPSADLDLAILPTELESVDAPLEFFRRRGDELFACVLVPVPPGGDHEAGGAVLAFQRIDEVIAAELERRAGSIVSFFAGGQLAATSRPELYQSEILSDLAESVAYQKVELEAARQTLREQHVGRTSFLSSYAPLLDAQREPVGILATITAFHTGGLDSGAAEIFSRIYFVCLLVLAAAVTVAFLMAGRLTRPISELTRGSERIRGGELGVRVNTRATGEIGRLVRSFNQMSEQLAESEARDRERREYIEAIIRHVGSGVVSVDAAGRVATVNEAAVRILHVDPKALLGATALDVRGDAALEAVLSSVQPLLEGQDTSVVTEVDVEIPGAEEEDLRSFRLVATPLFDSEGKPQGAVAVFEDLTDLIRSKKITAWAEMARQVAHEIKNPLTPMKLSAQQLRAAWRDRHPKFDRILEESTEMIVDRCEALRRIAVEFSDYARMPGRRIRREELGRLLREARKLYGEQENAAVDFRLDLPGDELYARVDRDEVMRLFINLFENSMQAMPTGGHLAVRAERSNGSAQVTIHDTGVGISPENLRRIFEPSFSTKTGGAGLGLPICRAIMEDYGGAIESESAAESGTTGTLSFPVDD